MIFEKKASAGLLRLSLALIPDLLITRNEYKGPLMFLPGLPMDFMRIIETVRFIQQ